MVAQGYEAWCLCQPLLASSRLYFLKALPLFPPFPLQAQPYSLPLRYSINIVPLILRSPQDTPALSSDLPVSLTLIWGNQGSSSSLLPRLGEGPPHQYSRHEAEFGASFHALPLLDVVGWDDALTAHLVLGFVPVGVLGKGQPRHALRPSPPCGGTRIPEVGGGGGRRVRPLITLVTATMVSTSPLQKGRSCSAVP